MRAAHSRAVELVELWHRIEARRALNRDLIPLIDRDFSDRAPVAHHCSAGHSARSYCAALVSFGAADASFGRPPNTTESIAAITLRWMISFLSMVM